MQAQLPDGFALSCTVSGPENAVPILFVHGFPMHGGMWCAAEAILNKRFRCIIPDLRGFGQSVPTSHQPGPSIEVFADDLSALLAAIGERRPVVTVGLSMGGIIAFELFRRCREIISALVLCDTRPNPESQEGIERRESVARQALERGSRAVADSMIGTLLAPGTPDRVREEIYAMMCETPPASVAAGSLALAHRLDSWPTLDRIDRPTLLIVGAEDVITSVDLHRQMHVRIRGSKLEIIPGAGHVPPMEAPARFAQALSDFVESL